jgi:hypothetical protein
MHKGWIFGPALLALAAAGCSQPSPEGEEKPAALAGPLIKGIYALRDCSPAAGEIAGTIRIVIPKNIDGMKITRRVTISTKRGERESDNFAAAEEPFDVFLNDSGLGTKGYAKVKVVIKNTDQWRFYVSADPKDPAKSFYGVGANNPNDTALCGRNPIASALLDEDQADDKQIALFYVDLKAMSEQPESYEAPFTIGLEAGTAGSRIQTPILIDPKIRNNGGR